MLPKIAMNRLILQNLNVSSVSASSSFDAKLKESSRVLFLFNKQTQKRESTERWRPSQILTPALTIALFDKSAARRLVTPLPIQSWRISI
jgi:hypothetical protein